MSKNFRKFLKKLRIGQLGTIWLNKKSSVLRRTRVTKVTPDHAASRLVKTVNVVKNFWQSIHFL